MFVFGSKPLLEQVPRVIILVRRSFKSRDSNESSRILDSHALLYCCLLRPPSRKSLKRGDFARSYVRTFGEPHDVDDAAFVSRGRRCDDGVRVSAERFNNHHLPAFAAYGRRVVV